MDYSECIPTFCCVAYVWDFFCVHFCIFSYYHYLVNKSCIYTMYTFGIPNLTVFHDAFRVWWDLSQRFVSLPLTWIVKNSENEDFTNVQKVGTYCCRCQMRWSLLALSWLSAFNCWLTDVHGIVVAMSALWTSTLWRPSSFHVRPIVLYCYLVYAVKHTELMGVGTGTGINFAFGIWLHEPGPKIVCFPSQNVQ